MERGHGGHPARAGQIYDLAFRLKPNATRHVYVTPCIRKLVTPTTCEPEH